MTRPSLLLAFLAMLLACCKGPHPVETFGRPPGSPRFDTQLSARLRAAWDARPPGYTPHTRHRNSDGSPKYTNRLFLESSPYLLQHAHNPVNWFPWGDEAFETARRLHRPVLLSVGYSTCHWCHVMEEESFEDEEIARSINEGYVPIKVDREERPDIDGIYMAAVQALTGSGGWPMTVWLTPDREPFAGGTYFPARDGDRGVKTGFLSLLRERRRRFVEERDGVAATVSQLLARVRGDLEHADPAILLPGDSGGLGTDILTAAERAYEARFDAANGGLSGAPKFPSSLPVRFLLRYHRRSKADAPLRMASLTLERMAAGGMHDQVGGGFHRYSTDPAWLVPHFEKMLYDNALIAIAYTEAYQLTGRDEFARVVRDTLRYLERDMAAPSGAFYCATDADSPGPDGHAEEGRFFTWTPAEIDSALDKDKARLALTYYAVASGGNFDSRSILHAPRPLSVVALDLKAAPEAVRIAIDQVNTTLYAARARRPAPLRDEKVLASWNGLAISAFARAAFAFDDDGYARAATRTADFVMTKMWDGERLSHSVKENQRGPSGYLDDYAFVTAGLLDLFETSSDLRWLEGAMSLDAVLAHSFSDRAKGSYFLTAEGAESLLARETPSYDGAEPSGNSVEAMNLHRLYELTSRDEYRARAGGLERAFADRIARSPTSLSEMLIALDFATDRAKEIVIVSPTPGDAAPLLAKLRGTFVPNRVLVRVGTAVDAETLRLLPLLEGKGLRGGKPTAYVCERQTCELPTTDPDVLASQLRKTSVIQK